MVSLIQMSLLRRGCRLALDHRGPLDPAKRCCSLRRRGTLWLGRRLWRSRWRGRSSISSTRTASRLLVMRALARRRMTWVTITCSAVSNGPVGAEHSAYQLVDGVLGGVLGDGGCSDPRPFGFGQLVGSVGGAEPGRVGVDDAHGRLAHGGQRGEMLEVTGGHASWAHSTSIRSGTTSTCSMPSDGSLRRVARRRASSTWNRRGTPSSSIPAPPHRCDPVTSSWTAAPTSSARAS
jgi:hypothetical protein